MTSTTTTENTIQKIRLGCVPEHFSVPLFLGEKYKIFSKYGLDVQTIPHPRGTGSMCHDLRNDALDVAIALTEGLIADMAKNKEKEEYKIIGNYVQSPLTWAIVTSADNEHINSVSDLSGKAFGVSRIGSGSHIMSFCLAERENWINHEHNNSSASQGVSVNFEKPENLNIEFKTCGGVTDLIRHLTEEKDIQSFLWEEFMLAQYIHSGKIKRLGEIVTPWPCFTIAATSSFIKEHQQALQNLFKAIEECIEYFLTNKEEAIEYCCHFCHLTKSEAEQWLAKVKFNEQISTSSISLPMIKSTFDTLKHVKILHEEIAPKFFTK